ncbi:leucine-rich repeat domain-containing protein [Prevotella communis]|uniref:leucine-rich repeat domain-containing protein n=1 Tax=Prevotella communis TaxID=2913614 RepID=UPI001EDB8315|nr:leucine-rich repeat domain-containing protein [Prevotella communis]UKK62642.1 leucine-rich repeat domain-containing protein [Prevotella communis]UKK65467.1 leucine-rich repeat domain-containing protein [Prevotella communis]
MKTISRYIMTLALLLTAVGGAWAQTQWTSGGCTVTLSNGTLTVSGNGAMADYTQSDKRPWDGNRNDITSVVVESSVTSVGKNTFESFSNLTSVTLPEDFTAIGPYAFCNCSSLQSITIPSTVTSIGEGAFEGCSAMTSVTLPEGLTAINGMTFSDCSSLTSITIPSTVTSIGTSAFKSCSSLTSITIPSTVTSIGDYAFMKSSAISDVNLYANPDNLTWGNTKMSFKENKATQCHVLAEHLSAYQNNFSSVNVTFVGDLQPLPTPIKVTVNDDKTEATFQMPQYDVTATYTIKRDISVDVTAQVGDGTDGVRYRVKKDGNNKFIPADMEMAAVPALFTVNDGIEQKALTQTQDYIVQIYAIDAEGHPTGNPMTFATFTFEPGIYAVRAVAADGSDYAGETDLSNTFQLFQGYEVEVAAKEFITYYKDEPLYADTETSADAVIYTIQSVNGDQATLSAAIETAPARTPLLIFNNSDEAKTFLLIPANAKPNLQLTVAPEFVGTLEATTIAASTDDQTNYALNGKAFVFVKNDLPVAANKAWLSINTGVPSARITIVFEDATKIANTNITNITNGEWYTIDGRKVNAPSKKGIYIMNGKKVVVK